MATTLEERVNVLEAQSTGALSRPQRKRSRHWKRRASMYPYLMGSEYGCTAGADAD